MKTTVTITKEIDVLDEATRLFKDEALKHYAPVSIPRDGPIMVQDSDTNASVYIGFYMPSANHEWAKSVLLGVMVTCDKLALYDNLYAYIISNARVPANIIQKDERIWIKITKTH